MVLKPYSLTENNRAAFMQSTLNDLQEIENVRAHLKLTGFRYTQTMGK
jgi:hypothetical protein